MTEYEYQLLAGNIHRIARGLGSLHRHVEDIIDYKKAKVQQMDKILEDLLLAQQEIESIINKEAKQKEV